MQELAHWIDGKAREASPGRWLDVFDPATGKPFARVADGDAADVGAAVAAAAAAFPGWSSLPATGRARMLQKLADAIKSRLDAFAHAASRASRLPLAHARAVALPRPVSDRNGGVTGKSVNVRVDLGGRVSITKK